jgi:hypothetical protein
VNAITTGEPGQDFAGVSPTTSHDSAEEDEEDGTERSENEPAGAPKSSLMEESTDVSVEEDTVESETQKKGEDVLAELTEDTTPVSRRGFGFLKKLSARGISSMGTTASPLAITSPIVAAAAPLAMDWSSPVSASLRKITVKDVWVRESLYRAAVQHQSKVWQTCLGLLSKMNEAMKEIEMERSVKLHAMLLDFLPRERRMFMGLPAVPAPVLKKLVALREGQSTTEEQIDEALHKRSRIVLRIDNEKNQRSSIMNRSRCVAPDLSGTVDKPPLDEILSDMMRFWRVIERKVGVKVWKTTLGVVTADYFLHLFDVSSHRDVAVGSSPEEAYSKLLPPHEFPTTQEARTDKLLKDLIPTESINLLNCSVISAGDQVEVTETFSGRWSDKATRKFFFKAYQESEVWENVLKRRPADEQPCKIDDKTARRPSF